MGRSPEIRALKAELKALKAGEWAFVRDVVRRNDAREITFEQEVAELLAYVGQMSALDRRIHELKRRRWAR
jgi:hypothetical protein